MAGYSTAPLAKKLGIKNNFRVKLINQPDYYFKLFSDLPDDIVFINDAKTKKDFIHCFTNNAEWLYGEMKQLKNEIVSNGIIWVSWYKKSAKLPTDITEEVIRTIALNNGLMDVKVCAVDEIWSGLKLMIPVKDRK